MTFERTWILAIAWLPLAWGAWEWTHTRRRLALSLKALSLIAILLALAQPKLSVQETKVALAVLVDTSASVSQADLHHAPHPPRTLHDAQRRHLMHRGPLPRSTRQLAPREA